MQAFNFDFNQFLSTYWHKKPVIIKQAFSNFQDPISPDEIAGLSMEEEVDSRFVSNLNNEWQVQHGPFESFENFPDTHSQLIIQAANHWHPGVRTLTEPFKLLPQWLFDDVMICLSMPHGGVGPHIDQYDVFIIQGMGKRRWRVGEKGNYKEANHHTGLRQIEGFDPIIDDILMPGDMLYIPPGFPHEGNTLDISLSYSVGFRSPKKQELLSGFADYVIRDEIGDEHLAAPWLKARETNGMIQIDDYQALNKMLMSLLNNEKVKQNWLGEQLSQSRHELDIMPAEPPWAIDELYDYLEDDLALEKVSGLKVLYHASDLSTLFINGESLKLPDGCEAITPLLADRDFFSGHEIKTLIENPALLALLLQLCNQGLWYPKA